MPDEETESQAVERSARKILRSVIITTIVVFSIIIVTLAVVTTIVLYRHNLFLKDSKTRREMIIGRNEIKARWARKNKVCIGDPPGMPRICMSWDWNEKNYKIGTVINYFCRFDFEVPESKSEIVRRVECNDVNRWVIIEDKIEDCVCPTEEFSSTTESNLTTLPSSTIKMLQDPLTGYEERTSEQVKFRHLHMHMLRPLLITLVIFLTIIIVVGTIVSALALYNPKPSPKKTQEQGTPNPFLDEMKRARETGTCVGHPPPPPESCIMWDWDEHDKKISAEILYYCHNEKDKRPNTKPIMRVICTPQHRWFVVFNKSYNCGKIDFK